MIHPHSDLRLKSPDEFIRSYPRGSTHRRSPANMVGVHHPATLGISHHVGSLAARRTSSSIPASLEMRSVRLRRAASITVSTGRQFSLEDLAWGNGGFTEAVVESLRGKGGLSKDRANHAEGSRLLCRQARKGADRRQTNADEHRAGWRGGLSARYCREAVGF
jgi:hypothetical protein